MMIKRTLLIHIFLKLKVISKICHNQKNPRELCLSMIQEFLQCKCFQMLQVNFVKNAQYQKKIEFCHLNRKFNNKRTWDCSFCPDFCPKQHQKKLILKVIGGNFELLEILVQLPIKNLVS